MVFLTDFNSEDSCNIQQHAEISLKKKCPCILALQSSKRRHAFIINLQSKKCIRMLQSFQQQNYHLFFFLFPLPFVTALPTGLPGFC